MDITGCYSPFLKKTAAGQGNPWRCPPQIKFGNDDVFLSSMNNLYFNVLLDGITEGTVSREEIRRQIVVLKPDASAMRCLLETAMVEPCDSRYVQELLNYLTSPQSGLTPDQVFGPIRSQGKPAKVIGSGFTFLSIWDTLRIAASYHPDREAELLLITENLLRAGASVQINEYTRRDALDSVAGDARAYLLEMLEHPELGRYNGFPSYVWRLAEAVREANRNS
jgi:hypothetical protein